MAESVLDTTIAAARKGNPKLWAASSANIPTRQAKFEELCLHLARHMPPLSQPRARRAVLEAAITRLEIGLREAGVGDLGVAREIRTLAAALHGRLKLYENCIINHDIKALITAALAHGITPAVANAAYPLPSTPKPRPPKNPLPTPAKTAKRRSISRD